MLNVDGNKCKLIFAARHGQGWHNVAEAKYGTKAWNEYWSKLNTDGEIIWGPDPKLTPLGEREAQKLGGPFTLGGGINLNDLPEVKARFSPLVVEYIRETNGEHTCDMRRTYGEIHSDFPTYRFEGSFTEQDGLWTPERETDTHVAIRVRDVLDRIFESDANLFISITSHSGWIGGLRSVTGHHDYNLPTGASDNPSNSHKQAQLLKARYQGCMNTMDCIIVHRMQSNGQPNDGRTC
ncbi:uncharacterized protein EI90DRAFT_2384115 [Cantharellus anzutake]|uniref:uncharacterized protein n=1 Tax=Cantharellus anzutake TaxID=1750568 RepID=UPI00190360B5|nr:uncharacterized protein EI90DRAFT_2384115 [Cantharellus anzutake]KAF8323498.1 hypothetical protein EI90DRAFT_2384115 [Cantharellus anzutake]